MRNTLDFSSWQGIVSTLLGLVIVSLIAVGIRLIVMQSIQQRRERQNRQINERLKTLIAAYKTLGGAFTGDLSVDPTHLRDLRMRAREQASASAEAAGDALAARSAGAALPAGDIASASSERRRRRRDAVEAALSDVILLGTADQVRLAVQAANDLLQGRIIETAELVSSLRTFIRDVLDLEPTPVGLVIPKQGPARTASGGSRGGAGGQGGGERRGGGGGGGEGGGAAAGAGALGGIGLMHGHAAHDEDDPLDPLQPQK